MKHKDSEPPSNLEGIPLVKRNKTNAEAATRALPQLPPLGGQLDDAALQTLQKLYNLVPLESGDLDDEVQLKLHAHWGKSTIPITNNMLRTGIQDNLEFDPSAPSAIYIFEEYFRLVNDGASRLLSGWTSLLILGTPGIGKSTLLWLWLLLSILQGEPVLFYKAGKIYVHSYAGVHVVQDLGVLGHPALARIIFLVDLDGPGSVHCLQVTTRLKIVAASSPNPAQYKKWSRHKRVFTFIMDPPRMEEIEKFYLSGASRYYKPGFNLGDFDFRQQLYLGINFVGFNLREHEMFMNPSSWEDALYVENRFMERISKAKSGDMLIDGVQSTPACLVSSVRGPRVPDGELMLHGPRSRVVFRLLHAMYAEASQAQLAHFRSKFSGFRQLASLAGYGFEAEAHLVLTSASEISVELDNHTSKKFTIAAQGSTGPPTGVWTSDIAAANLMRGVYYIPKTSTTPTFDAFIITHWHGLLAFQLTASKNHSVSDKGIEILRDCFTGPRYLIYVVPENTTFTMPEMPADFTRGLVRIAAKEDSYAIPRVWEVGNA
ncbi:hypothetical protein MKEN_00036300 [Mycena kentingensis (nom. inval.)]|nr:hypothetical protein MKEN_00036300 [Mycena kentingensis (nom. inval.)]